jgi:phosphatidylglycerol:prolipoprotein diacylglycerol transferase
MIPYFQILNIDLGPVVIQTWGTLVALGFIASILFCRFLLKRKKLNHEVVWDFGLAGIVAAIIFSRLFHVLFYKFSYFIEHPLEILYLWTPGYSLYGGMLGVFIGVLIVMKWRKLNFWQYADAIAISAPLGLFIGRIGCFLIHDHPGIETNFFLGVQYPNGTRWDLGLLQSLLGLILFVIFVAIMRKPRFYGFYSGLFLIYYGITRFALDFLRIWDGPMAETRYLSLTPSQYFSVLVFVIGMIIIIKRKKV